MNIVCPPRVTTSANSKRLGMDRLISRYRRLGAGSFGADFPALLEEAALQVEEDERWSAHLTDLLAVALSEAACEFARKGTAEEALARLSFLYTHGKAAQDLEDNWKERMESVPLEALENTLTRDLEKAIKAASRGKTALVAAWLEQTEARFLAVVERYETLSITCREITTESVLGHRFLLEGVENWLEALALFQDGLEGELDLPGIRELVLQGQKRLKFVESLKKRDQNLRSKYFVNYN